MAHLLDSDIVIDYLAADFDIVSLVDSLIPTGIALSVISYMEVYQGVLRGARKPDVLAHFTTVVPILDLTPEIARSAPRFAKRFIW